MNEISRRAIRMGTRLARGGLSVVGHEVHTPDGRTWYIEAVSDGGWRLFEVDRDQDTIEEHDTVEGDTWSADDLIDYLKAVGQPRTR